jgi:hypothetical protein
MALIQVNEITNSAGTGSVDAINGITIAGAAVGAPTGIAYTAVTTEAELDTALVSVKYIRVGASFNITSQKEILSGTTIDSASTDITLTGVGVTATEAMFNMAAGVVDVQLVGLKMTTAQTDIDCVAIQDTASRNAMMSCHLEVPVATTRSAIYIDGQRNRVYNNDINCNGSVSTPGCVLLDVNAANNSIVANVIE